MAQTREIRFKVSPEEYESIVRKADQAGMSIKGFMVFLAKGVKVTVERVE